MLGAPLAAVHHIWDMPLESSAHNTAAGVDQVTCAGDGRIYDASIKLLFEWGSQLVDAILQAIS